MTTKAKTPKGSAVEPVEPMQPAQQRMDLNDAVVGPGGTNSLAGLNHKTLDDEIAYQEKAVAALYELYQNELAALKQLRAERDSAQRKERRLTENADGTRKVVA